MRYLAFILLLFIIGCNGCNKPKQTSEPPSVLTRAEDAPQPQPILTKAPRPLQLEPTLSLNKNSSELQRKEVISKKLKSFKKTKVAAPPIPPPTPLTVAHPDHFYSKVWCKVSITLGAPISDTSGVVEITDEVPKAAAYSIILRGEPADQFEIRQEEQVVSAPSRNFPSSTVYFDVKPLTPGKKKLVYQVKARESVNDPGIGLPEVVKDIVVEVNRQSLFAFLKNLSPYLLSFLGALGSAFGGWLIKKWFSKKSASQKDKEEK